MSQTHIYSVSHPQVDRLSAQKETSNQLLGPGPALPGLTLTLVKMNMLLLYCVLTMYLYPFNPPPYSNVLCAKVKVCGFLRPSPAWLRPPRVAISPSSRPHTHRGMTQRTRRIQVSPVISLLDTDNVETFELEDIRLLERSKRTTGFRYEVFTQNEAAKALQDKI